MRIRYNSPAILTYSLLSFLLLLTSEITNGEILRSFTLYSPMDFSDPLNYWRLFSYSLGHQDWSHFIGNFSLILVLGPTLEERYGSYHLLFIILLTSLITGVLHILFFPASGIMGASGIVFLFIILISFTNTHKGEIPLTFIVVFILFLTKEFLDTFKNDQISQLAHILGGVLGSILGFVLNQRR